VTGTAARRDEPSVTGELNIAEVDAASSVWVRKYVALCYPYLLIYDTAADPTERDLIALTDIDISYDDELGPGIGPVRGTTLLAGTRGRRGQDG
jgi:hypothetical protein